MPGLIAAEADPEMEGDPETKKYADDISMVHAPSDCEVAARLDAGSGSAMAAAAAAGHWRLLLGHPRPRRTPLGP